MTLALCLLLCAPAWACDDDACRDDVGQLARMSPAMLGAVDLAGGLRAGALKSLIEEQVK